ncbi:hypothetical protein EGW08_023368 [Elysia chlorotica]|uniref:Galectin n=1 Tax=Elysia chlorotica TaxID=188477 RepID=A0A433SIR7_ELYCH|nr:hypothetical protein EGW08_023368 [Elysia chlorotica]
MIMLPRTYCILRIILLVPGLLADDECTAMDMQSRAYKLWDCRSLPTFICNMLLCNPRIPLNVQLLAVVQIGLRITVYGKPKKNARRFTFNLKQNGSEREMPSIALHFDARFDYYSERRVIVINSNIWGERLWRNGVRIKRFPFTRGSNFKILFIVVRQGFEIYVNEKFIHTYRHIVPLKNITHVFMNFDVDVDRLDIRPLYYVRL